MHFPDSLGTGLLHGAKHSPPGLGFRLPTRRNAGYWQHGANHSPPSHKFQISGDSPASGGETPFHQVSYCQIVSKCIILDSDCNDFRRRFQLCPPQVLNPSADGWDPRRFIQNLQIFMRMNSFYGVSWCQLSSLVAPDTLWSLHTNPGSFSRSLIFDDF